MNTRPRSGGFWAPRRRSAQWNVQSVKPTQGVDDDVLLAFAKMPSLKHLNLSGCRAMRSQGFETLASMPLRYLWLEDLPELPEALRTVVSGGLPRFGSQPWLAVGQPPKRRRT